jgi:hypothetical protein
MLVSAPAGNLGTETRGFHSNPDSL